MISKYLRINVILFMIVGIKTLEFLFFVKTFFTKEKVVTIFTHVAVLNNLNFACKTFIFFIVIDLRFEYYLHLMIRFMIP